jgi:predicted RNA polymerase sigma factor
VPEPQGCGSRTGGGDHAARCPPVSSRRKISTIAALHADARTASETDWAQIVEWYDELLRLTDSPIVRLNREAARLQHGSGSPPCG